MRPRRYEFYKARGLTYAVDVINYSDDFRHYDAWVIRHDRTPGERQDEFDITHNAILKRKARALTLITEAEFFKRCPKFAEWLLR